VKNALLVILAVTPLILTGCPEKKLKAQSAANTTSPGVGGIVTPGANDPTKVPGNVPIDPRGPNVGATSGTTTGAGPIGPTTDTSGTTTGAGIYNNPATSPGTNQGAGTTSSNAGSAGAGTASNTGTTFPGQVPTQLGYPFGAPSPGVTVSPTPTATPTPGAGTFPPLGR
jgi:hypothetical protein